MTDNEFINQGQGETLKEIIFLENAALGKFHRLTDIGSGFFKVKFSHDFFQVPSFVGEIIKITGHYQRFFFSEIDWFELYFNFTSMYFNLISIYLIQN